MISSPSNQAVKRIRGLRSRKEREASGLFFAEGIRIVVEAAELHADIETVVVAPDLLNSEVAQSTIQRLRGSGIDVLDVTPRVFESLSGKERPQGIGAVIRQRWEQIDTIDPDRGLCSIVLEAVADPGNLGTILRTADAVGVSEVILVGPTTDPYDPTALRGSMGALFGRHIARTGLDGLARWKRDHAVFLVGTSDAAETDYRSVTYPHPLGLFMGSERQGLSAEAEDLCDAMVRIPMVGKSDSLNLAVATGVMLYEIFNQRYPLEETR